MEALHPHGHLAALAPARPAAGFHYHHLLRRSGGRLLTNGSNNDAPWQFPETLIPLCGDELLPAGASGWSLKTPAAPSMPAKGLQAS